jgi:ubiquinone biosynthesis protein UbiJ
VPAAAQGGLQMKAERLARLRRHLAEYRRDLWYDFPNSNVIQELIAEIDRLQRENEELRRDLQNAANIVVRQM